MQDLRIERNIITLQLMEGLFRKYNDILCISKVTLRTKVTS